MNRPLGFDDEYDDYEDITCIIRDDGCESYWAEDSQGACQRFKSLSELIAWLKAKAAATKKAAASGKRQPVRI